MLRNLFGAIALDSTLEAIGMFVDRIMRYHPPVPRDTSGRPRVIIDGTASAQLTQVSVMAGGNYANWYSAGGPNSIDAREQMRELSRQTASISRQRWS